MTQQKIRNIGDYGSRPLRVLDMLTPLNGAGAPAVNAKFLGQVYVDDQNKAVYLSVAVGSEVKANDWEPADANAVVATLTPLINALKPLTGIVAPAEHAAFEGQIYIDTVAGKMYMAIDTDAAVAANDWKELSPVAAG